MKVLMGILLLMSFQTGFAQQTKEQKALGSTSSFKATLKSKLVQQRTVQQPGLTSGITMATPNNEEVKLNIRFEEEVKNSCWGGHDW